MIIKGSYLRSNLRLQCFNSLIVSSPVIVSRALVSWNRRRNGRRRSGRNGCDGSQGGSHGLNGWSNRRSCRWNHCWLCTGKSGKKLGALLGEVEGLEDGFAVGIEEGLDDGTLDGIFRIPILIRFSLSNFSLPVSWTNNLNTTNSWTICRISSISHCFEEILNLLLLVLLSLQ